MADTDPMTKGECAASKLACKEYRTLEHQNLILRLREEVTKQVDQNRESLMRLFDEQRREIDARFREVLRDIGYQESDEQHPAATAVPANPDDHPARRQADETWRARIFGLIQKHIVGGLMVVLALFVGAGGQPWFRRIAEALTVFIEAKLK